MSLITIIDVCGRDLGTFFCDVCNNQSVYGIKTFANNTASSNSGNGALVVTGGAGIGGNLNVGGTISGGAITMSGNNLSTYFCDVCNNQNVDGTKVFSNAAFTNDLYTTFKTTSQYVGSTYVPYFRGNYLNKISDGGGHRQLLEYQC